MPNWIEPVVNVVVLAFTWALLVKDRDKGILRRICQSKYQFRNWLKSAR